MYISTCTPPYRGAGPMPLRPEARAPKPLINKTVLRAVKLTAIFLIVGILQVSGQVSAQQRIGISLKISTLEKVSAEIEKRPDFTAFSNVEVLKTAEVVTLDMKYATIEDVMHQCLMGLPLEFTVQDKTAFVKKDVRKALLEPPVGPAKPEPETFSGVVKSAAGAPLMGATIYVPKLKKSAVTDKAGEFILKNVPNGEYAVLDESAVIAYGTTSNRLNTGDVTTITSKEIEEQPVSNPLAALEGRVPGLVVTHRNGSPLNLINPTDIERIEVLKDAEATAIYGSRAANMHGETFLNDGFPVPPDRNPNNNS